VYRTMISRPGPLSLDPSSRLNHRAFASVTNLVPLESTIRWVSLALFFYDIEGQPSAGSVSQQRKRGLSDAEGVPSGSLNFRSKFSFSALSFGARGESALKRENENA
jgi:hypothetical protein